MKYFYLSFICLCAASLWGQGFEGTFHLGLNASQIDGDDLVGYDKLGATAGIKISYELVDKVGANLELNYSQRGSAQRMFQRADNLALSTLNYFELPLYITYGDWYIEKEDYYKMKAHFGLSYAALVSGEVNEVLYNFEDLNSNDISYLLGATYSFNKSWGLTVRYTRSLNKLSSKPKLPLGFLLGYFWTVRCEYTF